MSHSVDPFQAGDSPSDDAMLRRLLSELAGGRESAPDLTDSVMGRLGFVRCSAVEAQQLRRRSMLNRAAIAALALTAAFAGYMLASQRNADAPMHSLVPAVGGAMERQGRTLGVLFECMPRLHGSEHRMPVFGRDSGPAFSSIPVLLVPVPVPLFTPCDAPDFDCPTLRRAAAAVPYPQT